MITFKNVWKTYRLRGSTKYVLKGLTMELPRDRNIAVVGRNGAGKSTLLKLISGAIPPDKGTIEKRGKVSWPLGFAGGFHPLLSGRQNARFIARIYGADTDRMVEFVKEFSELGSALDQPIKSYSTGMRARLAFGVSMAANFDCYLVDEITAVGDISFRRKCQEAFRDKMAASQIIMVSHSEETLKNYCSSALLLEEGTVWYFDELAEALDRYRTLVAA